MKHRWRGYCAALLSVLALSGCGESEKNEDAGARINISPEEARTISEKGGVADYLVQLIGENYVPVQVTVVSSEPARLMPDRSVLMFSPSADGATQKVQVRCIDNGVKDGDHAITLTMISSSMDSGLNGLRWERTVTCVDDDTQQIPVTECTPGQMQCLTPQMYRECDIATGKWFSSLETCPANMPVCNMTKHVCEASAVSECTAGQVQCLTDQMYRLCDASTGKWSTSANLCPSDKPVCDMAKHECKAAEVQECKTGQMQCLTDQMYRLCDPSTGKWSTSADLCPSDKPVCNMTNHECEAKATACVPKCSGNLIQQCGGDGKLLAAASCEAGSSCKTVNGVASCVKDAVVCTPKCSGDLIQRCNGNELMAAASCGTGMVCSTASGAAACVSSGGPVTDSGYIEVNKTKLIVYEGGSSVFTVVPATAPTSSVVVTMSVTDATEGELDTTALTFTTKNWSVPQTVRIRAPRDGQVDGNQDYQIRFTVSSGDNSFNGKGVKPLDVTTVDTESDAMDFNGEKSLSIRAMAANLSSGNYSAYSPGHGVRIFKALKPDIVMIQEFNWYRMDESDATAMKLVYEAFGSSYYTYRGAGDIPNGIISRYPIIDSGYWKSNKISNRDWNWALIDLPGKKELLVISVHLSTSDNKQEAPSLMTQLSKKITADKAKKLEYYLMIGGDFNSDFQKNGSLKEFFDVYVDLPVDQNGLSATNATRKSILDHVFVDKALAKYEVPVEIGSHSYDHGHVFDSRVYGKLGELGDVPPVQEKDSGASNMQHMGVVRDFEFSL